MSGRKTIRVTQESGSGRNERFLDTATGRAMNRAEFVRSIEAGTYSGYHVRKVNGLKTPASNPDRSESNNLG